MNPADLKFPVRVRDSQAAHKSVYIHRTHRARIIELASNAGSVETHFLEISASEESDTELQTSPPDQSLAELVNAAREEAGDLPITALLHGWGSEITQTFFNLLLPCLIAEDALWLITTSSPKIAIEGEQTTTSEFQEGDGPNILRRAVVLNLKAEKDRRTYHNLFADLLFFPALEEEEQNLMAAWPKCARKVVVDESGHYSDGILRAAQDTEMNAFLWTSQI